MALKAEAQAFVDRYKLKKDTLDTFILYKNLDFRVIVSGIGVSSSRKATQTLINHFDIKDKDIFINIGICGASKRYKISEILKIGSIVYEDIVYNFDDTKEIIYCVDREHSSELYDLVDMESYGFYDAVIHNPAIKDFSIYKVVSDYFEPQKVTKDFGKNLILKALKEIF